MHLVGSDECPGPESHSEESQDRTTGSRDEEWPIKSYPARERRGRPAAPVLLFSDTGLAGGGAFAVSERPVERVVRALALNDDDEIRLGVGQSGNRESGPFWVFLAMIAAGERRYAGRKERQRTLLRGLNTAS
jgi:hypothetical protein